MKALVIGLGELGWRTLQLLAHSGQLDEVVVVDQRPELAGRAAVVDHGVATLGATTRVRFEGLDLFDLARTAETIARLRPDLIVNTASLHAWWMITRLPEVIWRRLHGAGFGVWLPANLAPAYALMQALRDSGHACPVVNMAFPDAVNVILSRIGLGPTLGGGNVEELVPPLESVVARQLQVPRGAVRARLVTHHRVNAMILDTREKEGLPLMAHISVAGEDVTATLDIPSLLLDATADFPPGAEDTWLIATSAAHKAIALLSRRRARCHATGPLGLPGGYPVVIEKGIVRLDLPPGVSEAEAVAINEEGARQDGIETIGAAGEVTIRPGSADIVENLLGWSVRHFTPDECIELGREVAARFRTFAAKAA